MAYRFKNILLSAIFSSLSTAFPVWCATYEWVDRNGVVGFSDTLQQIPPEFRQSAKRIEGSSSKTSPSDTVPSAPPSYSGGSAGSPPTSEQEEFLTFQWRERLREAQTELARLKAERAEIDKEYTQFRGLLFKRGLADPNVDTELREKLDDLDAKIQEKEHEISTTIPDEARQSGLPPGLLDQSP